MISPTSIMNASRMAPAIPSTLTSAKSRAIAARSCPFNHTSRIDVAKDDLKTSPIDKKSLICESSPVSGNHPNRYDEYQWYRENMPIAWDEENNTWLVFDYKDVTSIAKSENVCTNYLVQNKMKDLKNTNSDIKNIYNTLTSSHPQTGNQLKNMGFYERKAKKILWKC